MKTLIILGVLATITFITYAVTQRDMTVVKTPEQTTTQTQSTTTTTPIKPMRATGRISIQ